MGNHPATYYVMPKSFFKRRDLYDLHIILYDHRMGRMSKFHSSLVFRRARIVANTPSLQPIATLA